MNWHFLGAKGAVNYVPMSLVHMDEPLISEDNLLIKIGKIAGECYNSSKDDAACKRRALSCIERGHHSPWEHHNFTLKCVVDRGTSHALVRHRHCAFQQSSTIYQRYNSQINIVAQPTIDPRTGRAVMPFTEAEEHTFTSMSITYLQSLNDKMTAGRARDLLPTCLATTLIITTNVRELEYIIQRRQGPGDSERMHVFDYMLEDWFNEHFPLVHEAFCKWYLEHPL